jgi:hypothetical protein
MTPVRTVEDFAVAFSTLKREHADGFSCATITAHRFAAAALADLGLNTSCPVCSGNKDNATAGGLMNYGADFNYMYRHAAIVSG